eukprot:11719125-Prorocentrum_lima.AAC.1
MSIVAHARHKHDEWLEWSPDQRAAVGSSYCYGDQLPFPPRSTVLESHLRIELMESIPKPMQLQCKKHGMFDSMGILVRVMRKEGVLQIELG